MKLLSVRLCGNLGPQKLYFDVSPSPTKFRYSCGLGTILSGCSLNPASANVGGPSGNYISDIGPQAVPATLSGDVY